jgi:antitoxin component YwqK of YwqJK toxin-antitoxin module
VIRRAAYPWRVSEPREEITHFGNGRVKYTGFMLDGEMHGDWSWYRTDGSLMRTGSFDRGRQIGTWRTFDRSGAVVKETQPGD